MKSLLWLVEQPTATGHRWMEANLSVLTARGWQVRLVNLCAAPEYGDRLAPHLTGYRELGLTRSYLPALPWLAREIRRRRPHVLVGLEFIPAGLLALARGLALRRDVPLVYVAQHLRALRGWPGVLHAAALREATAVTCVSRAQRDSFVAEWAGVAARATVIHSGIAPAAVSADAPQGAAGGAGTPGSRPTPGADGGDRRFGRPGGFRILLLGRLRPEKGHAVALAALDLLASEGLEPAPHLLFAGGGSLRPAIEADVARRGLGGHVTLLGHVDDVGALLASVDVLVMPSHRESFGLVAIEAFSMSVPVVASAVGGLPEVLDDGAAGILVPPDDPEALAAALVRLHRDPALRRDLGARGRARYREHFHPDRMGTEFADLVEELVPGRGGGEHAP